MPISRKHRKGERGQVLILCAVSLVVLLLFVGLAIDFGLAYVTKASLGKAVDAAALTGARNLYQGTDKATTIATSSFAMNYNSSRDAAPPVVNVAFTSDPGSSFRLINVNATTQINTFFIRILPSFKTLNIATSAQARRARVVMTLVLDTSSSMPGDGGAAALPPAVDSFVNYFDDSSPNLADSIGIVTFNSTVSTLLPMQTGNGFKAAVNADMAGLTFNGHTFSDGGLQQAIVQNNSAKVPGNIQKVVVFFTDGLANVIQDTLVCNGVGSLGVLWNYGGESIEDGGKGVDFLDPTSGAQKCSFTKKNTCCSNPGTFPSVSYTGNPPTQTITQVQITQTNVEAEAKNRAIADGVAMRNQNMIVYSIALGSFTGSNLDFFYQVANDPRSSTFDSTKPVGEADFAPTAADLQPLFEKLASKIILRLTQ